MADPIMGQMFPTLLDFKNKYAPGENEVADVCEILYKTNPMFEHIPWRAGNQLTGNTFFVRTELPTAHTRAVNQGIQRSMSKTTSYTETTEEFVTSYHADLHAMNELFAGSSDANAYLAGEEKPHIYALGQKVLEAMLYGNNPAGIRGFMTRLGSLSGEYADQVIDASEVITPDAQNPKFRSILMVKWNPNEVTGIYNKHGDMGMTVKRFEAQVPDRDGNPFMAYVVNMHWHAGLMIRNREYVLRIANIDISKLNTAANRTKLFELMLRGKNKIKTSDSGNMIYYMSNDLYTPIELAAIEKGNLALSYEHIQNDVTVTRFAGYELSKNDIMDFDEEKVVAD